MMVPDSHDLTARILAAQPDPRAQAVLVAGYQTFLQYGVRRASMQDIADRAGMSRAALYLHFKNKNDIFRALMSAYFAAAAECVSELLVSHTDPVAALVAAFDVQTGQEATSMITSPHAEELLSLKQSAAADIVTGGYRDLAKVYGDWIAAGVADGTLDRDGAGPDPHETAATMLAALDGLKHARLDWAGYAAARHRLAMLFGRALRR